MLFISIGMQCVNHKGLDNKERNIDSILKVVLALMEWWVVLYYISFVVLYRCMGLLCILEEVQSSILWSVFVRIPYPSYVPLSISKHISDNIYIYIYSVNPHGVMSCFIYPFVVLYWCLGLLCILEEVQSSILWSVFVNLGRIPYPSHVSLSISKHISDNIYIYRERQREIDKTGLIFRSILELVSS